MRAGALVGSRTKEAMCGPSFVAGCATLLDGARVLVHTFDTDGTPLVVEHVVNDIENDCVTSEVRLSGTSSL